MDPEALQMLADSLRTTMSAASGAKLDAALSDVGWLDMLDEIPDVA
ncbi:MAG: acyl-CoA dehydrogenase, partial [Mycobacterium sp.]